MSGLLIAGRAVSIGIWAFAGTVTVVAVEVSRDAHPATAAAAANPLAPSHSRLDK
jgi:hypothetical protein